MKVIFESKLARLLVGFKAILLFVFLFCKKRREFYSPAFFVHENTHCLQWKDCALLGWILGVLFLPEGLHEFMALLWMVGWSILFFHILYVLNYIGNVIFLLCKGRTKEILHTSYRMICFEREARYYESNSTLWVEPDTEGISAPQRKIWGWIKFLWTPYND